MNQQLQDDLLKDKSPKPIQTIVNPNKIDEDSPKMSVMLSNQPEDYELRYLVQMGVTHT